jgi:hypothetical protein
LWGDVGKFIYNSEFNLILLYIAMKITEEQYDQIIKESREELREFLISKGVDITTQYGARTAVHGKLNVTKYLVEKGVDVTTEYGARTAVHGQLDVTKYLVENGVDVTTPYGARTAQWGDLGAVKRYIKESPKTITIDGIEYVRKN